MLLVNSQLRKNPRDALGGDVVSELTVEKKPRR
jgi:hypothetical protein